MLRQAIIRAIRPSVFAVRPVSIVLPVRALSTTSFLQQSEARVKRPTETQETSTTQSIPNLLPLKYEQDIYATIKIHNRPYLITEGDEVILPFRMKHGEIGDVLNFTNVTTVGSRNYTYHVKEGGISPELLTVKGVIVEKTKKPMVIKEVTKRRNRHVKHTQIKHDLTILRISELKLTI